VPRVLIAIDVDKTGIFLRWVESGGKEVDDARLPRVRPPGVYQAPPALADDERGTIQAPPLAVPDSEEAEGGLLTMWGPLETAR